MRLREGEAAAVANVGIVGAELVAVIAQRERLRQRAGQRREAAEMAHPLRLAQPGQADLRGGAVVAKAQGGLRERGRLDRVEEAVAQLEQRGGGAIGLLVDRHGRDMGAARGGVQ